jgi:hypothetical protein
LLHSDEFLKTYMDLHLNNTIHTSIRVSVLYLLVLATLLTLTGCPATYRTTKRSELKEQRGQGPIRALTVDSALYTFETFTFSDTDLSGQGTVIRNGMTNTFNGSVSFQSIVFIERLETSIWKGVWVLPVVAGILPSMVKMMQDPTRFEISRPSGSCPYVYAYDGTTFKLEAEAFGTSVSKALEAETYSLLPSLVPVDGRLTVRVANERPETHLINSVHLFVGDVHEASSAVLDVNNTLWPIRNAQPPVAARDHSGNDILLDICENDRHYWKSDLAHTAPLTGFRDQLEIQFNVPHGASEATLIIDAMNTDLITEAYRSAGRILGDATMEFYDALERNPELQHTIQEWIRDCSLKIEVEEGDGWKNVGSMAPEATVVPFSRAIRILDLIHLSGPLRIRLSSLTDVWRIDAVAMDFSAETPIPTLPLKMVSVKASDGQNWEAAVAGSDSTYALILPPNYLDVAFDAARVKEMQHPVYAFAAKGFLYEWLPSSPTQAPSPTAEATQGGNRVELFRMIIQHKDLFLPAIYAEWRKDGYLR